MSARSGGGLRYLSEQLRALDALGRFSLRAWVPEELARELTGLSSQTELCVVPRRPLLLRMLWEQTALAREARHVDVVYLPANFAMFVCPRPQLLGIQNANHFGSQARWVRRSKYSWSYRLRFAVEATLGRLSVRRAERVVAVSAALRHAVEEDLGSTGKLTVVPSAAPSLPPVVGPVSQSEYALSVAHDYPHKDWDGVIDAFTRHSDLPPLTIVGTCRSGDRLDRLRAGLERRGASGRIRFLGAVTDPGELARLYAGARCFVAHSFLEACPLTPLEALSYATPVVASDLPAHREVCGGYATYYPPDEPEALAEGVRNAVRRDAPTGPGESRDGRTWTENAQELGAIIDALSVTSR